MRWKIRKGRKGRIRYGQSYSIFIATDSIAPERGF